MKLRGGGKEGLRGCKGLLAGYKKEKKRIKFVTNATAKRRIPAE